MKKKRSLSKWIIFLTVVVFFSVGFYFLWNGSLFGKKLPVFSGEVLPSFTPLVTEIISASTQEVAVTTPMEVATPIILATPTPLPANIEPVCGQKEPMILLGLGIDENEQADVIRLVRVDFVERKILILSIPRDFWVPIPGMSEYNITQFKINAAYGYGEYFYGPGQGVVEQSNTIYQNYGVSFDRYVVFHYSNFEQMINAVGGVDVVLDKSIGVYGVKGTTHLDGQSALLYARNRYSDNDGYRVERQSQIIKALFDKMIQPENIVKIPGLGIKFLSDKTLITDLSLNDISTFICMAKELSNASLIFRDIPTDFYQPAHTNTGRYIDIPSPEVASFIKDLVLNGNY